MIERIALAGLMVMVLGLLLVVALGVLGFNPMLGVGVFLFGGFLAIFTMLVDMIP